MEKCSYIPRNNKGEELLGFQDYRKALGYTAARDLFLQVISPSFQSDYKRYIKFDAQNVPTYESVLKIPYVKNFLGAKNLAKEEQKSFPWVTNSRNDYERLVNEAYNYNTNSPNKDNVTAIVKQEGDKIRVELVEKNEQNDRRALNQYAVVNLNKRLAEIFGDLGVTVELLEQYESEKISGQVDFSKALNMANGFEGLIRIANNAEGVQALPEEFAHAIIGIFRDSPIVARSLNILINNENLVKEILGDEYDAVYSSYGESENIEALVAEEALGRVLQDKLLQANERKETDNSSALNRLISRFINWIKGLFKNYDINDVIKAKEVVNDNMGKLGRDFLNGTKTITKEDIQNAYRNAVFNHLKEDVDNVLQLVENALETERKRLKITSDNRVINETKERILTLKSMLNDKDKLKGVITYAKYALEDIGHANEILDAVTTFSEGIKFKSLRNVKTILDSYAGFITDFGKTLNQYEDAQVININGEDIDLQDLWGRLETQFQRTKSRFEDIISPSFLSFIAPFYDAAPLKDKNGNVIPLKRIFRTADQNDIDSGNILNEDINNSYFDKWCIAMGNSSSVIAQMFYKVVSKAKNTVRLKTIDSIRDVWKLREKAEARGITSFEFMFERNREGKKTGNYISEINAGQFEEDYQAMMKSLEEKYGKNPFGEDYKKYNAERRAWLSEHAQNLYGKPIPNETYHNHEYDKLTKAQKETLEEFLQYKASLEAGLPTNQVATLKAIQRRKSGTQRFADAASNPTTVYENIKENVKQMFTKTEDDDQMFGNASSGLVDFNNNDFMTLPLLYTRKLSNPEELSTDIYSDLMSYAYSTQTFRELSKVVDQLEIGKEVVKQKRLLKTRGGKPIEETVYVDGKKTKRPVYEDENSNNLIWKIQQFLESQMYGRYIKEEANIDRSVIKGVSWFQKATSLAYLGCNVLSGIANVVTAIGMQHIEAAASEFFGAKELMKADATYGKLLGDFILELPNRNKQSKLALFDELFNVRQNVKDRIHNTQMKNIFRRFFGKNWLFIQQGMGDHWIYNRTAIAMAMREKVLLNGKKIALWDALEIVEDKNGYKKMQVKEGVTNLDGSKFFAGNFSDKVAHINHTLVGIYNDEDQNAANSVMIGRLAMQMRKWILPQMMRRFQSKRNIAATGQEEEGYYRTFTRFGKDVWKSGFKIITEYKELSESDKANVRRAFTEILQTLGVFLVVNLIGKGDKDPDRKWGMQFLEYLANRELHELGFLTPSPWMLTEGLKTITSPLVSLSAANKVAQAIVTTGNPFNWFPDEEDLIKSGRYEGHSYIYKRIMELPLPPMTQFRHIDKLIEDLDEGTRYYARDYR